MSVFLKGGILTETALIASATGALNVNALGPIAGKINKQNIATMIVKINNR